MRLVEIEEESTQGESPTEPLESHIKPAAPQSNSEKASDLPPQNQLSREDMRGSDPEIVDILTWRMKPWRIEGGRIRKQGLRTQSLAMSRTLATQSQEKKKKKRQP